MKSDLAAAPALLHGLGQLSEQELGELQSVQDVMDLLRKNEALAA